MTQDEHEAAKQALRNTLLEAISGQHPSVALDAMADVLGGVWATRSGEPHGALDLVAFVAARMSLHVKIQGEIAAQQGK